MKPMRSCAPYALALLAGCATGASSDDGIDDAADAVAIDAPIVDGQPQVDAEPACSGGAVQCGNACIDPQTDETFCGASGDCSGAGAGQSCSPSSTCEAGVCTATAYSPVGPQENVDPALLVGWTPCLAESFDGNGTSIAGVLASCSGPDLMLACRAVGATNLQVLAWAPKATIVTDTGASNNGVVTVANGTAWYFNNAWSWGFAAAGATVAKQSCDTEAGSNRLCWHTSTTLTAGYRCGDATAVSGTYQRLAYTR